MTKKALIQQATKKLEKLSPEKLQEVMDFAEFLIAKTETSLQNDAMLKTAASSKAFSFVNEDIVEYSLKDAKSKK
jgi:hypothetical protein